MRVLLLEIVPALGSAAVLARFVMWLWRKPPKKERKALER